MGDFMRQYWIPALASVEVKADGDPLRLMLLGEKLIAFRDTHGRVGVMDHHCPHRGASLFFGRNEADGLRCVYHGWKFDVGRQRASTCRTSRPSRLQGQGARGGLHVHERNGLVWVYMGPRETPPPLPDVEANNVADGEVRSQPVQRQCNWMQALEGDIDTSHFGFLHVGHLAPGRGARRPSAVPTPRPSRAPALPRARTRPGGTVVRARTASVRPDTTYWRVANFMFPFWTQTPQGEFDRTIDAARGCRWTTSTR